MNIPVGIILVLGFIGLQGFFAASEMSLVSQNRLRLHHLADRKDRKARMILSFLSKPERFLATTLVGQNIALIISSTLMNVLVYRIASGIYSESSYVFEYVPVISTFLVFPLIIIFGQIVPMSVSRLNSYVLARWFIMPLRGMSYVLYPLVMLFSAISSNIARLLGSPVRPRNPFVSREELRLLFRGEGQITDLDKEGREMIHEIFDLQSTFAEDIMTPLIDVTAAPDTATVDEVVDMIVSTGYSHIPIYHGRIDRITGVVYAYDLINIADGKQSIEKFLNKPYIVPETKPVFGILMEFRENNKHLAFAVDEYGGVTGLLTMEDIIEEIVGEISDEYDDLGELRMTVGKDITVVDGTLSIAEFEGMYGVKLPEKGVETTGGFIISSVGRIPKRGERISLSGFEFEILQASDRKVERIAIKPLTTRTASDRKNSNE
jgi:putative hemolysin